MVTVLEPKRFQGPFFLRYPEQFLLIWKLRGLFNCDFIHAVRSGPSAGRADEIRKEGKSNRTPNISNIERMKY